jgi:hypothetical protein
MVRPLTAATLLFAASLIPFGSQASRDGQRGEPQIRVAMIGVRHPATSTTLPAVNKALERGFAAEGEISLVEPGLIDAAIRGIGYGGSINMPTVEARGLGGAIGCDFFVVGKSEVLTRSDRGGESHEEAYVAILIADSRTGRLALSDFVRSKAPSRDEAVDRVVMDLASRIPGYAGRLSVLRSPVAIKTTAQATGASELVEDIPEEGSARAEDFTPPQFINRVKPTYTPEADLADVTATVDASAVFRSSGEVGEVEITRWAGFGLDETSEKAIRMLKFKPATRAGRPVTVRASIRYNFRRLQSS